MIGAVRFHCILTYVAWLAADLLTSNPALSEPEPWENSRWRSGLHFPGFDERVTGLVVYQDKLVAVGMFSLAGAERASSVAILDAASWKDLGAGLGHVRRPDAVTIYRDELVVGGDFDP